MASIYGRDLLGTMHERIGEPARPGAPEDRQPDGVWGRFFGFDGDHDGGGDTAASPSFDYRFAGVQVGVDVYRNETDAGDHDRGGLYFAYGHAKADVDHRVGTRTIDGGDTSFDAWSLGGYWTRMGREGWYVDGVFQLTWYDAEMSSNRGLLPGSTDGWGLALSGEGGYPFDLGDGWGVEPQVQLVYQTFGINSFDDSIVSVRYSDADSLAGRVGARVFRTWDAARPGEETRPSTLWARFNLWKELSSNATTSFSTADGWLDLTSEADDSWWEFEVGSDFTFGDRWSIYGTIDYSASFDGDSDAVDGGIGIKYRW
jgi:outer membrane autotransporter protein